MGEAGGGRGEAEGWQAEQEGPAVHQPPAWPASRRVRDTRGKGELGVGRREKSCWSSGKGEKRCFPQCFIAHIFFFFPAVSERVIKMLW